ncbi:MAG: hydantoinase/oxoprolinase family protein [Candidatus Jordarchaeum sp.]|uniref:hydantoinase/oxoprolinase family protein n=1 Tax=Candidatus Jordarchaeum sp. TaxID=2823881 RepID=UPI004049EFA5
MLFLGWDIGGVNTKAVALHISSGKTVDSYESRSEYFPIWEHSLPELPQLLIRVKNDLCKGSSLRSVGVTMTAELSDAYQTKREGVNHILDSVEEVFPETSVWVVDVDTNLLSLGEARKQPLRVAAANWAATAWMVGRHVSNCILVDVGSTTTDIIPIVEGKPETLGKTDTERLISGELVYSGVLRTTIPSIVHSIPVWGKNCRVSSEKFALVADVHLLLNNISEEEYSCETADGRGKTVDNCLARLARMVCADTDILHKNEIYEMAQHIYQCQLAQIKEALIQVAANNTAIERVMVTGLGRNFLARRAALEAGFKEIIDLGQIIGEKGAERAPAYAMALMVASLK